MGRVLTRWEEVMAGLRRDGLSPPDEAWPGMPAGSACRVDATPPEVRSSVGVAGREPACS